MPPPRESARDMSFSHENPQSKTVITNHRFLAIGMQVSQLSQILEPKLYIHLNTTNVVSNLSEGSLTVDSIQYTIFSSRERTIQSYSSNFPKSTVLTGMLFVKAWLQVSVLRSAALLNLNIQMMSRPRTSRNFRCCLYH